MAGAQSIQKQLHKVQKGETIYAISRLYNITAEQLEAANPHVVNHKIKKGMQLVIPTTVNTPVQPSQEAPTVEVVAQTKPAPRTHYESLRIGVLLPLEEQSERVGKLLEFYKGMLMAADSVRGEGCHLDIHTWHCGKSDDEMRDVLKKVEKVKLDIIFGPADAVQIPTLATYCNEHDVRLVLPFSNNFDTNNYPNVYVATPSQSLLTKLAAKLVLDAQHGRNYVFVHTNQPDNRGSLFVETLRREMSAQGIDANTFNIDADDSALEIALNEYQQNYLIVDNTSIRTLNILLSRLDNFRHTHPEYSFSLQGYPEWQAYTSSCLGEMYAYDTYAYANYFKNPLSPHTQFFQAAFTRNFGIKMSPSIPQYALMGFDLGYFFIHGLCTLGDCFEMQCNDLTYKPFQHPFIFKRESESTGFTNSAVQLIHYTPQQTLEIVTPL